MDVLRLDQDALFEAADVIDILYQHGHLSLSQMEDVTSLLANNHKGAATYKLLKYISMSSGGTDILINALLRRNEKKYKPLVPSLRRLLCSLDELHIDATVIDINCGSLSDSSDCSSSVSGKCGGSSSAEDSDSVVMLSESGENISPLVTRLRRMYAELRESSGYSCGEEITSSESSEEKLSVEKSSEESEVVRSVASFNLPPANCYISGKEDWLNTQLFDLLSSTLNSGHMNDFEDYCSRLNKLKKRNYDVEFTVLYMKACANVMHNDHLAARDTITCGLQIAGKTTRPTKALVAMLTKRCWLNQHENKLNYLEQDLDVALQAAASDPTGCQGLALGWTYVNKARLIMTILSARCPDRMRRLRKYIQSLLNLALEQFYAEDSQDGPYGVGIATSMLAKTLLACGFKLETLNFIPTEDDIDQARKLLSGVEDRLTNIPGVLQVSLQLSWCDYHIRCGLTHLQRAREYAESAAELARCLGVPHMIQAAQIRVSFLKHDFEPFVKTLEELEDSD